MNSFEILVLLMFAAVLLVGAAQKLRIPYPIALVIGGAAMGFLPGVTPFAFDPNFILPVVLPPLLYYAAFWTPFRDFNRNLREIFSLALGLVVTTTLAIGCLFKWLFPELPWALAFAFGAIVSPPDAFAATTILRRFNIPTRLLTVLEGESLINDASALVLYKLAVVALVSGVFSLSEATLEFVKVVVGGILIGAVLGFFFQLFTKRFLEPVVATVFSFVNPYLTYILAERMGYSGVLAVVTNGLIGSYLIIKYQLPRRRILGYTAWDIFIILLNCFVFILLGSHLRTVTQNMSIQEMILYSGYGVLITLAMIAIRTAWVFIERGIAYFLPSERSRKSILPKQVLREITILSWSGMRGIVSLAAALALPFIHPLGLPLFAPDVVIFITFIVILLTLLIPPLTLPLLLHFWNIHPLSNVEIESHIRHKLVKVAEAEINRMYAMNYLDHEERAFLISYFQAHHRLIGLSSTEGKPLHHLELARLKAIQVQRNLLLNLWENDEIDDKTLRFLEQELDIGEAFLARAEIK
jgi:CPA1 family monovalent cation:H+ antiporter